MTEVAVFRWVEIEGFRGFRDRQRIMLDASAVLVRGPNGSGKTSFFDALQWLLVGSLERLEQFRTRRNTEHIANAFRGSEPAVVEAELCLGGKGVRLRRRGRYDGGVFEWSCEGQTATGPEAEGCLRDALNARREEDLRRLLLTSALLQQDVVRRVLEDRPAERYEHLATLLGLDSLTEFDRAARQRRTRLAATGRDALRAVEAAEIEVEQARAKLAELERTLSRPEDVSDARTTLLARLDAVHETVEMRDAPDTGADAALLQDAARVAGEHLLSLFRSAEALEARRRAMRPVDTDVLRQHQEQLEASERALQRAEEVLNIAEERLRGERERASRLSALASQALELLGATCPVCRQTIDEEHVRKDLEHRLGGADTDTLSAAMTDVERARAARRDCEEAVNRARNALAPLAAEHERQQTFEADLMRWRETAASFASPSDAITLKALREIQDGDLDAMSRTIEALRILWLVAGELAAVMRSDQSERQLIEARVAVERATERLEILRESATRASLKEAKARILAEAATRAVTAVTERRFRQLAPLVRDIYERLDPHPAFRDFDFVLGIYNGRGVASPVVIDNETEVEADPLLVFSSSQANVTALSYFLAVGWAAGSAALPFVLLDDPLQSMDDVNALGFADLCRHLRRQRQMVVSTHDRRLGALLERKLTPRLVTDSTMVLDFKAWTPEGPQIEQRLLAIQAAEGSSRSVVEQAA